MKMFTCSFWMWNVVQIENQQNTNLARRCDIWQIFVAALDRFRFMFSNQKIVQTFLNTYKKLTMADNGWWGIKGLFTWKWGTPERWGTSPTHGKEIPVFTCNPRDAGWGPKCNHLVAKHKRKQRTIVFFWWSCFLLQCRCRLNFGLIPLISLTIRFHA